MTTGKKRPRIIKGSKAGVEGSKSAVESTHTNPYLYFLDAYQKKAKAANKGPKFIIAKYSKLAAEVWKKMSDAEKAPFVDMAKERKARINKNVPREKKKNALPVFRSRCSPLKLVKVNEALTKEQKDAVERVGFGSMLKVKCRLLNREFISRLVNHFNPATKSLEFGRVRVYTITPDDVRRALGFSCGTIAVPTNCEENHFEHIRKMFGEGKKPLKRGVTFAMMQQVFKTGISDVKFQTSYVLFVLSCLLCPTTKDVAATRFYPAVHDLSQTPTYAWAEFVFDWLVKEISKYKKRSAKVADSKNKKDALGVGGCMLLLMLIYFDKQPMGMKVGSEGDPMIQSWTTKLIKERIAKEENLELVDPISGHFPEPRLRHPLAIAAYHDLKKYFLVQMQHLEVLDRALMGDVPETCTRNPSKRKASNERQSLNMGKNVTERKNPNEDYVEIGDIDMDLEDIPSASTLNTKKVGDGVDVEDSGIDNLVCARKMPFYSSEHVMADVVLHVQHVEVEEQSVVEKQVEKEEDEEEEQEEEEEEEEDEEEDNEEEEVEEQVPLTPPLNKRPHTRIQKWISQSKLYS